MYRGACLAAQQIPSPQITDRLSSPSWVQVGKEPGGEKTRTRTSRRNATPHLAPPHHQAHHTHTPQVPWSKLSSNRPRHRRVQVPGWHPAPPPTPPTTQHSVERFALHGNQQHPLPSNRDWAGAAGAAPAERPAHQGLVRLRQSTSARGSARKRSQNRNRPARVDGCRKGGGLANKGRKPQRRSVGVRAARLKSPTPKSALPASYLCGRYTRGATARR